MIRYYAVLDTETTGLPDNPNARVIEVGIGLYAWENHALMGTFSTLVQPDVIDPEGIVMAEGLCGITRAEVESAPSASEVAEMVRAFVRGYPILAWNLEFDQEMYERTLGSGLYWSGCVMQEFACRWVRVLGREPTTGNPRRASLRRAAGIAGVTWEGQAHRALADALVTGAVFARLRTGQLEPPEPDPDGVSVYSVGSAVPRDVSPPDRAPGRASTIFVVGA